MMLVNMANLQSSSHALWLCAAAWAVTTRYASLHTHPKLGQLIEVSSITKRIYRR